MRVITCCIFFFFFVKASAQDFSSYEKMIFNASSGLQLPYRILYPQNYNSANTYPVVLLLHGGGERGTDNEKQLTHGAKLFLSDDNRKNFPCLVIIPQCPTESYWGNVKIDRSTSPHTLTFDYNKPETIALQAAIELTKSIIKNERVNKKQVYITGLSMGGMGTFEAVYRYPKLFAAAVPICGGGDVDSYHKQAAKVPFRIFHGSDDAVIAVDNSKNMVETLKNLNAHVSYTEYPGVNHNSWENAFAEPDFLSWLFSKRK